MKQVFAIQIGILVGIALIGIALLMAGFSKGAPCRDFDEGTVTIGSHAFAVDIAKIPSEQVRGLAGCPSLAEKTGMYFPQDKPTDTAIWMKGMVIPIDIVWIAEGKVIAIHEYVPPPSNLKTELLPRYTPPQPVTGILEIAAGETTRLKISVGDLVTTQDQNK